MRTRALFFSIFLLSGVCYGENPMALNGRLQNLLEGTAARPTGPTAPTRPNQPEKQDSPKPAGPQNAPESLETLTGQAILRGLQELSKTTPVQALKYFSSLSSKPGLRITFTEHAPLSLGEYREPAHPEFAAVRWRKTSYSPAEGEKYPPLDHVEVRLDKRLLERIAEELEALQPEGFKNDKEKAERIAFLLIPRAAAELEAARFAEEQILYDYGRDRVNGDPVLFPNYAHFQELHEIIRLNESGFLKEWLNASQERVSAKNFFMMPSEYAYWDKRSQETDISSSSMPADYAWPVLSLQDCDEKNYPAVRERLQKELEAFERQSSSGPMTQEKYRRLLMLGSLQRYLRLENSATWLCRGVMQEKNAAKSFSQRNLAKAVEGEFTARKKIARGLYDAPLAAAETNNLYRFPKEGNAASQEEADKAAKETLDWHLERAGEIARNYRMEWPRQTENLMLKRQAQAYLGAAENSINTLPEFNRYYLNQSRFWSMLGSANHYAKTAGLDLQKEKQVLGNALAKNLLRRLETDGVSFYETASYLEWLDNGNKQNNLLNPADKELLARSFIEKVTRSAKNQSDYGAWMPGVFQHLESLGKESPDGGRALNAAKTEMTDFYMEKALAAVADKPQEAETRLESLKRWIKQNQNDWDPDRLVQWEKKIQSMTPEMLMNAYARQAAREANEQYFNYWSVKTTLEKVLDKSKEHKLKLPQEAKTTLLKTADHQIKTLREYDSYPPGAKSSLEDLEKLVSRFSLEPEESKDLKQKLENLRKEVDEKVKKYEKEEEERRKNEPPEDDPEKNYDPEDD